MIYKKGVAIGPAYRDLPHSIAEGVASYNHSINTLGKVEGSAACSWLNRVVHDRRLAINQNCRPSIDAQ